MATSKQKAFRVLQFAKTESAITVQRAFRIKFGCQPPNDNNILRFNPSSDDSRLHMWGSRGESLNPAFALQRHIAPTAGSYCFLGKVCTSSRGRLRIIEEPLNHLAICWETGKGVQSLGGARSIKGEQWAMAGPLKRLGRLQAEYRWFSRFPRLAHRPLDGYYYPDFHRFNVVCGPKFYGDL
ncbi:hypothetical protein TNCV_324651 [Trichonephila clavipes]|nr:hypothetical protein TNCV_324651 [Trichonephila clavipes]